MVNSYVCTSDYCLNLSDADIGAKKQFEILRGGFPSLPVYHLKGF